MLPFTTWSWNSNEQIQAMQLISWDDIGLSLRGQIQHLDVPRRGVLVDQTVYTVSGREVVSTDVTNPDLPVEGGAATLAWNVQHLVPHGNYWLQLESSESNYIYWRVPYRPSIAREPVLYVTSKSEPNVPEVEVPLEPGQVLGVAARGHQLMLLQDVTEKLSGDYWEIPELQSLAVRVYDITDPLAPELVGEELLESVPYMGGKFEGHALDNGTVLWASKVTPYYGLYYIDIWPGPWYQQNALSYLVSTTGPDGSVVIPAYKNYPVEDFWSHAAGWFWEPPVLLASLTHYEEHPRPDGYPDYQSRTTLVAVDFSIPEEPLQLQRAKLPSHLMGVEPLEDGINHFLYFEPDWNVVSVWGWDRASTFPLFRQVLHREDSVDSYSYSLAWMPPFHMRSRYEYLDGLSSNHLDAWVHAFEANRFIRLEPFDFENEWFSTHAVKEPEFLLGTTEHVHVFSGDPVAGTFERLHQLEFGFPHAYDMNLAGAVKSDNALNVPVGIYGVEVLPLPDIAPGGNAFWTLEAVATGEWTLLGIERWSRTDKATADDAGAMVAFQWLFHADSLMEIDPDATDGGDLWRDSAWFGWYAHAAMNPGWIYHLEHGNLYTLVDEASGQNGFYLFDADIGYLWSHETLYPYLYAFERDEWLYYLLGSGLGESRWFYGYNSGWFSLIR
jgi:hypothetical protein